MATKLSKAITTAQYSQLWDVPENSGKWSADNEPVLSKVWRLSIGHDTGMISAFNWHDDVSELALNKRKSYKLECELMEMAYRFAVVSGRDEAGHQMQYIYAWNEHDRPEFKANLLRLAQKFNQASMMFQTVNGAYERVSCIDGVAVSLGKDGFGVLNGHFYKVVEGRGFGLESIEYAVFEPRMPTEMRSVIHIARMDLDEYLNKMGSDV